MRNEVIQFVNRWLYNVELVLRDRLESLKDDLGSDDDQIRGQATEQASEILDWLMPPSHPLSHSEQLQRIQAALLDEDLSPADRRTAALRAGRSTGRPRGRPRDETSQQAIRALGLHLRTSMSWREIALELRGCEHTRPNPERSCEPCGASMRNAATRLQSFLKSIGHDFKSPDGEELDEQSRVELRRLWYIEKKSSQTPEDNSLD